MTDQNAFKKRATTALPHARLLIFLRDLYEKLCFLLAEFRFHTADDLVDVRNARRGAVELVTGNGKLESAVFNLLLRNTFALATGSNVEFFRFARRGEVGDILVEILLSSFLLAVGNGVQNDHPSTTPRSSLDGEVL